MSRIYFNLIASGLLFLIFLNGCSGEKELLSNWTNRQITIDGEASDWQNNLEYLKDYNVAIGVKNDNKFMYLCLTTNDFTKVFPMLRGGFITWIEPENNSKTIGIKYPIHNNSYNDQVPNTTEEIYNRRNPGEFISKMIERQNELQILNEDKVLLNDIPIKNKEGIEAKLGYHSDRFVYELKVPLNDKNAYKFNAIPGEKLNIKFETEEPDRKNFDGERKGDMRMSDGEEGERREFGGEGRPDDGRRFGMQNANGGSFKT